MMFKRLASVLIIIILSPSPSLCNELEVASPNDPPIIYHRDIVSRLVTCYHPIFNYYCAKP